MSQESNSIPRARSLVIGLLLAAFIGAATPYNEMIVKGSRLGLSSCTPAAFFLLFVGLLIVNPLLRAMRRSWALTREELLVVFAMMMVATAIPTRGFTGMFLSMISGSYYYAAPENQWATTVLPYVPDWMVVRGEAGLRHFYEGVPAGESAHWQVWVEPLFYWFIFMAGLWVSILCLVSILRRQWVERERLPFPVAQVPLAMVEQDDRLIPPFFRNRLMWLGFAIPFLLGSLTALHHYYPPFPALVERTPALITMRGAVRIPVRLNPLMFGFAYLISLRLSLSLWFFYLVKSFLQGAFSILGVYCYEQLGPWTWSGPIGPIFAHQSMGAMIVLVAFSLWVGRGHLRHAVRRAFRPDVEDEAVSEMASYRWAVVGLLWGWATMAAWLWRAGVPWWVAPFVIAAGFVIFLSLTRAIIEGGLATIVPAMVPLGFTLSAFGTNVLGVMGIAALSFTLVWAGDLLTFMMAPCAHAARIASDLPTGRRRIFIGVLMAMACSLLVSVAVMIALGYGYGAANLHPQYFQGFARYPASTTALKLRNPVGPNLAGWGWTGMGALVMSLLTLAWYRFPWWPLHPMGYMVSPAWIMGSLWFPFFVAWLLKSLVIKFGGIELYRRTRWIVYGIIVGQIVVAGFWLVIDVITGTTGNRIRVY